MDVYGKCPEINNGRFLLRLVREEDCAGLLKVYSDEKAVPLFNSDNCHGDCFHYTSSERMTEAIRFWLFSYKEKYFVRWSIIDQRTQEPVGTIELFNRDPREKESVGLLRLDLRSDYENTREIALLLNLIVPSAYEMFGCASIWTKAVPQAVSRRIALASAGFMPADAPIIGDDGTAYGDYWVRKRILTERSKSIVRVRSSVF